MKTVFLGVFTIRQHDLRHTDSEDHLEIEVRKVKAQYVVEVPSRGVSGAYSVFFDTLEEAHELALACAEWFPSCRYSRPTALLAEDAGLA